MARFILDIIWKLIVTALVWPVLAHLLSYNGTAPLGWDAAIAFVWFVLILFVW